MTIFQSSLRTASGYIYEYDEKMCKYTERERWKPYNKEEVVFSIDFTNLSQFFNCQYGFRLSQIYGFVNPINLRIVDFDFTNNITILTGASATGKTASFSFIRECMAINPDIVCINYQNYQKDIKEMLAKETGKLIVIDNADILLDDDTRKYISMDEKNQYLIIGRNPKNLFTTSDNLFELVSEKKGEQTEFRLKKYL